MRPDRPIARLTTAELADTPPGYPLVLQQAEPAQEDIRNALSILTVAEQLTPTAGVLLQRADFAAVCARLWSAVEKLERKRP